MIGKCWTLSNEKIMKIGFKPMMSLEDMIKDSVLGLLLGILL